MLPDIDCSIDLPILPEVQKAEIEPKTLKTIPLMHNERASMNQ